MFDLARWKAKRLLPGKIQRLLIFKRKVYFTWPGEEHLIYRLSFPLFMSILTSRAKNLVPVKMKSILIIKSKVYLPGKIKSMLIFKSKLYIFTWQDEEHADHQEQSDLWLRSGSNEVQLLRDPLQRSLLLNQSIRYVSFTQF